MSSRRIKVKGPTDDKTTAAGQQPSQLSQLSHPENQTPRFPPCVDPAKLYETSSPVKRFKQWNSLPDAKGEDPPTKAAGFTTQTILIAQASRMARERRAASSTAHHPKLQLRPTIRERRMANVRVTTPLHLDLPSAFQAVKQKYPAICALLSSRPPPSHLNRYPTTSQIPKLVNSSLRTASNQHSGPPGTKSNPYDLVTPPGIEQRAGYLSYPPYLRTEDIGPVDTPWWRSPSLESRAPTLKPRIPITCIVLDGTSGLLSSVSYIRATLTCLQMPRLSFHATSKDGEIKDWELFERPGTERSAMEDESGSIEKLVRGIIDNFWKTSWHIKYQMLHRDSKPDWRSTTEAHMPACSVPELSVFFDVLLRDSSIVRFFDLTKQHEHYPKCDVLHFGPGTSFLPAMQLGAMQLGGGNFATRLV